jgi:site-specific recombinase XerD
LGLRFTEAYELERWTKITEEHYQLKCAKESDKRIINTGDIDERYRDMLENGIKTASIYSYRTLLRTFTAYFRYPYAKAKNKSCKTHIFRHIKALELKNAGLTNEEIQEYFGHKTVNSTKQYTENDITL